MNGPPRALSATAVTSDLLARARLEDGAARAGISLVVVGVEGLRESVLSQAPDVLILDLDAGGRALLDHVVDLDLPEGVRVLGFVSHVDVDLTRAARAAGCETYPRGRFWRALPELLADQPD